MNGEPMLNDAEFQGVGPATGIAMAVPDPGRGARIWWERILRLRLRPPRRLRLCESLPLGERRFVAVVEFERMRFLVGGTSVSMVLLAQLGQAQDETLSTANDHGSEKAFLGAQL